MVLVLAPADARAQLQNWLNLGYPLSQQKLDKAAACFLCEDWRNGAEALLKG